MKNVKNNAKNKSLKGIPVKYKGEIILLDPLKTSIATFGLTASLVIAGIAAYKAPQLIENISENIEVNGYENDIIKDWEEKGYLIFRNDGSTISKYDMICQDILSDKKTMDVKVAAYISHYPLEAKLLFQNLAQMQQMDYSNIKGYVNANGFESVSDWKENYEQTVINTIEQEEKQEQIKKSNQDLATYWIGEIKASDNPDDKIYEFYTMYNSNDELVNEIISQYAFFDDQEYINLEQYLVANGFNSKEEWLNYHQEKTLETKGRGI